MSLLTGSLTLTGDIHAPIGTINVDAGGTLDVSGAAIGDNTHPLLFNVSGTVNIHGVTTWLDAATHSALKVHSGGVLNTFGGLFNLSGTAHEVEAGGLINIGSGGMNFNVAPTSSRSIPAQRPANSTSGAPSPTPPAINRRSPAAWEADRRVSLS